MSDTQVSSSSASTLGGGVANGGDGADNASSPAARGPRRSRISWRERFEITFLAGPAVVVFVLSVILPVFRSV